MDESFVVGLKHDEILRRRTRTRRLQVISSGFNFVLSLVGLGLALVLLLRSDGGWVVGGLLFAAMLLLLGSALVVIVQRAKLQRWAAGTDLPPYALRMTRAALELGVEGASAPVVLPWPAVRGFRRKRKLGQSLLQIAVQPGVTSVSGRAGLYSVAALDQPVEAIDQALHYFSNGTAAVSRGGHGR
ncbi:hypothetical protein [Kribbella sp. NPDC048915]|uniref:hypothetical protein n=1 Tax=Kribbella sp. NPDC048915 TaxID=3155148 RepID=UPI003407071C